jgi:hypothetical protein
MLMVALVFLRLFPIALRFVAWATHRLESPTVALGLSRMTRAPMQYSRLILLLLLATAVGMFAAGYRATLERGYDDRSAFEAGAPSRLESIRQPSGLSNDALKDRVASVFEASDISLAIRASGSYQVTQFTSQSITMLGVVPGEFERLAFWRDDFAGPSLGSLLARLKLPEAERPQPIVIPAGSRQIGLWAQFPLANNVGSLGIRTKDENGVFWDYNLVTGTPARAGEWRFFVADLTRPQQLRFNQNVTYSPSNEKTLDAVYVRIVGQAPQVADRVTVLVDDLQVSQAAFVSAPGQPAPTSFTDAATVEPFEDLARYVIISGASPGDPGTISFAAGLGRDGTGAGRISFARERGAPSIFGMRLARAPGPLPIIAENEFTKLSGKHTGDEFIVFVNRQYVNVKLVGTFDLFPGHDPTRNDTLMVADLDGMQELASILPSFGDTAFANEAWMSFAEPGIMDRETLQARGFQADGLFDLRDVRAAQDADPLVAASWEGILFLSFAAVLLLTGLGFAVYATLAVQSRSLEFAILRTMGYTSRQVLSLVSFEQLFVIVAGVVVGTFLGFPLGRLMIGYLGVTESGADPVPPLVSQVSWQAVLTVYGLLAIVFIGTIASLAAVYSRLAVHRALRIGEV